MSVALHNRPYPHPSSIAVALAYLASIPAKRMRAIELTALGAIAFGLGFSAAFGI